MAREQAAKHPDFLQFGVSDNLPVRGILGIDRALYDCIQGDLFGELETVIWFAYFDLKDALLR